MPHPTQLRSQELISEIQHKLDSGEKLFKTEIILEPCIDLIHSDYEKLSYELETKFQELRSRLEKQSRLKAGFDSSEKRDEAEILEYFQWLDTKYLRKINQESKQLAEKIKNSGNYKNAMVIGMGGSGINSLVLQNALANFVPVDSKNLRIYIQNNLDPSSLYVKLKERREELDQTLFVIISKSGNTDEVRRNINTILNFWQSNSSMSQEEILRSFAKQSVLITEPAKAGSKNFLHRLKNEIQEKFDIEIPVLDNDPNIGGRFSMFSPVGLFSAELLGINSEKLLDGAEAALEDLISSKSISNSQVARLAVLDIALNRSKTINRCSMVYSDSLEGLNKFRAQLKGESLNKNGIDSTVHIPGIGTVNHHSDLELLLKTQNNLVLEQICFAKVAIDHLNQDTGLACLSDLKNQSNHNSLIKNHISPLFTYCAEKSKPVILSVIPEQTEKSLAYYLMQDMLVTIVQAGLQDDLNKTEKLDLSIRQWEVETYKKSI
jgi:glucose-6-phosphate isomerase